MLCARVPARPMVANADSLLLDHGSGRVISKLAAAASGEQRRHKGGSAARSTCRDQLQGQCGSRRKPRRPQTQQTAQSRWPRPVCSAPQAGRRRQLTAGRHYNLWSRRRGRQKRGREVPCELQRKPAPGATSAHQQHRRSRMDVGMGRINVGERSFGPDAHSGGGRRAQRHDAPGFARAFNVFGRLSLCKLP